VADEVLKVIINGEDKLSGATKSAEGGISNLGKTISTVLTGAAVVGAIVGVGAFLMDAAKAAAEEETGIIKLGQAVKNSGGDWDTASVAIEAYLEKELQRTALDDGDGRAAIQKLTEATGSYEKALDLMAITQDLAAAKGMDLATAGDIIAKVVAGQTSSLTRYGIVLEEGTTAEEALLELHARFGGQAEAVGNSYEGSMKKFDIATGNLKETIGGALLPMMTPFVNTLVDLAQRAMPYVESAIQSLQPVFEQLVAAVKIGVEWIQAFWSEHGEQIIGIITALWETITAIFRGAFKIIGGVFAIFSAVFKGDWSGAWEAVKKLFVDKWELIKSLFTGILKILAGLFGTSLDAVLKGLGEFGTKALAAIKKPFQTAYDWLKGLWDDIKNFILHVFDNVKIPLPHFSLNWTEVLGIRIPSGVKVDWYGSGLDAMFNSPTLIGVGESGPERVQVTPAGKSGGGGGGGDTWNINISPRQDEVGTLKNLLTLLQMGRA